MRIVTILIAGSALVAVPAYAEEAAAPPSQESESRHQHEASAVHAQAGEDIVVTADYVEKLDVIGGQSVVSGDNLVRDMRGQIGDSLTSQPGVSATSFTPGASRPVLRGFQGERIRVLTDGLGSLDASNTSADHGVTIDPLTAERIEILRGPAVLLFGGQAIGGAVNVIDRRIPRSIPESGFHIDALGGFGSAAQDASFGASADFALAPNLVAHLDGSYRRSQDQRVGGFVLSPELRAEQFEIAEEELDEGHVEEAAAALELAGLRGKVPNTGVETYTLGGGLALINDGGSLGVSIGYYDSSYGVPARPGAAHHGEDEEEHGEAPVTIGMKQWRADIRGQINTSGFLDSIRLRLGYADYEHTEFEGDAVGTVFRTDALEGRLELVQADRGGWRGATGAQVFVRDFAAIGAEAFVPANQASQLSLFTLQEFKFGPLGLELAGRYEHSNVSSTAVKTAIGPGAPTTSVYRAFDAFSGAIGLSYDLSREVRIGITGSRAARAPSAEELFANGPHIATQSYEVGDPDFGIERSWGLETYVRGKAGPLRFSLSGYAQWFSNYIYEVATGAEEGELPVFQFFQADARYLGVEGEIEADLVKTEAFKLTGSVVADYVNAQITSGGSNVPRIPPLRIRAGLSADAGVFGGHVEVERVFAQNAIAALETPTAAFTMVNASVQWHPFGENNETVLVLSANNLFDVDARRHASFTKDFVPIAGRDLRVSLRLSF